MKLFEVDDENNVRLNVPWIKMIPEFKAVFLNQTGVKLSYEKDAHGRKILTFIYFAHDFSSPLRDWEEEAREAEALKYADLTKEDVSKPKVKAAVEKYKFLSIEACRALKTYKASLKGLDSMDAYLQTVDFTETDKQGKLLYTPNQYVANLALTNKAYDELKKLASRVTAELEQVVEARGKASMSDRELKYSQGNESQTAWDETVIAPDGRTQWTEIGNLLKTDKDELA